MFLLRCVCACVCVCACARPSLFCLFVFWLLIRFSRERGPKLKIAFFSHDSSKMDLSVVVYFKMLSITYLISYKPPSVWQRGHPWTRAFSISNQIIVLCWPRMHHRLGSLGYSCVHYIDGDWLIYFFWISILTSQACASWPPLSHARHLHPRPQRIEATLQIPEHRSGIWRVASIIDAKSLYSESPVASGSSFAHFGFLSDNHRHKRFQI